MDLESTSRPPAGLLRRLAALLYDLLIAVALAFVATFAMLPFTHGEAILTTTQGWIGYAYHAVLLLVVFAYFGASWTHSGQTVGCKAWRIRLERGDGTLLGWGRATTRFLLGAAAGWLAALGGWYLSRPDDALARAAAALLLVPAVLNFAWIAFDRCARSLQDLAGDARVVRGR